MSKRFDDSAFQKSIQNLQKVNGHKWEDRIASTLLMLSRRQVPFRDSNLQKSGMIARDGDGIEGAYVAYNEEYAAFQHEGVRADGTYRIRSWRNGRKGKFLEDPMAQNISTFQKIAQEEMNREIKRSV